MSKPKADRALEPARNGVDFPPHMEKSPGEAPSNDPPPDDLTVASDPTHAGPREPAAARAMQAEGQRYRILRPHAQGGLGAVHVALDLELNREVALKQMLDAHAGNSWSRERFVLEAEVTGSLEHPGIVPIYGLGADEDGKPFYAMRFIRGDNLMEAIERFHGTDGKHDPGARALGQQKLLRRFLDVCNAIDYAHGRGVLHRDIKPGNIIVGKYGETLVVDWGLAKVQGRADVGSSQREKDEPVLIPASFTSTTKTIAGTYVGTPAFMSPEQARGDVDTLGPPSDVYSLGATLYCLLTGRPPFEGSVNAVLEAVRKGNFERPRRRDAAIERALEAICLRAMALAPADRYASVRALADDIERWLADEPVTAVRDPWWTRLRRWTRRHRAVTSGLGVGALTVFTALAISTVLVNRERAKAEANFQQARAAVDTYFTTVSESKLLDVPGLQPLRRELLDAALEYYRDFLREHGDDPSVRRESAAAFFRAGWIASGSGDRPAAIEAYQNATRQYEMLARDEPEIADHRRALALCHGAMAFEVTDLEEAVGFHRKALSIRQRLVRENPADVTAQNDVARTYGNIASVLRNLGKPDAALTALDSAATIGETLVAMPLDTTSAVTEFTRQGAPWFNVREDLAQIHLRRTDVRREVMRLDAANASWERAYELHRELVRKRPRSLDYQNLLGVDELAGASLRSAQNRNADALELVEHAQQIFTGLVAANPSIVGYRGNLAEAQLSRANTLVRMGRRPDALQASQQAVATARSVMEMEPTSSRQTLYVRCSKQRADVLMSEQRTGEALAILRDACRVQESVAGADPQSVYHRSTLATTLASFGNAAVATGEREEARQAFLRAADLSRSLGAQFPGQRYNQACFTALAIPLSPPAARDSMAAAAVALLRQAIDAGYGDRQHMAKDSDLDPLRARADFRQLMARSEPGP
jgi:serine/threonine-protein kinase